MTIAELKRLIAELPDSMTVEIFASESHDEMIVAMAEVYSKQNCLLLLDRYHEAMAETTTGGKLVYDIRDRWEG